MRLKISRKLLRKIWLMILMVCSTLVALFNILFNSAEHSVQHILAHAANQNKHLQQLRKVLSKLQAKDLKLNLKKCEFGEASINYMGHFLSSEWLFPEPEKMERNHLQIQAIFVVFRVLLLIYFKCRNYYWMTEAISSPESWLCKVWRTGKWL